MNKIRSRFVSDRARRREFPSKLYFLVTRISDFPPKFLSFKSRRLTFSTFTMESHLEVIQGEIRLKTIG